MTVKVLVKGNCADSGPDLVAETSLRLLRRKILLYSSSGGPTNSLRLIVSQTPSYTVHCEFQLSTSSHSKGLSFDFKIGTYSFLLMGPGLGDASTTLQSFKNTF